MVLMTALSGAVQAEEGASASSSAAEAASSLSASSAAQTDAQDKTDGILGKEAEGENIAAVIVENASGQNITWVSVIDDMTDLPIEGYLAAGETFADGEKRMLYYDFKPAEDEAKRRTEAAGEGAEEVRPAYQLRINTEDGTRYDLHDFAFADMEECRIEMEDGVAYLVYTSKESGETVSTKDAEKARKEAEQAAQEQAAQQAYVEPVYQEPVYQAPVYQEPAPVIDAGGGDQCITDGLTW